MGALERSETECRRVRGGVCVYASLKDCIGVDAKRVDGLISFKERRPLFFFLSFSIKGAASLIVCESKWIPAQA